MKVQFSQPSPSVLVDPIKEKIECIQDLNCLWNLLMLDIKSNLEKLILKWLLLPY